MSRTFLRPAISFAISCFSLSDSIRNARGKISSSSMRMCCLYMAARLATELRNSAISPSDRFPRKRHCVPRRSTVSCNRAADRCSSSSSSILENAATTSGSRISRSRGNNDSSSSAVCLGAAGGNSARRTRMPALYLRSGDGRSPPPRFRVYLETFRYGGGSPRADLSDR